MDIDDLARGLAAGFLTDTVRSRGKSAMLTALGVAVVALIGSFLAVGVGRGLLIILVVLALLAAVVIWVIRKGALVAIRAIGEPQEVAAHRDAIDSAIAEADLPTGPVSAARFAWRIRRGRDTEVARLRQIVASLRSRLEA